MPLANIEAMVVPALNVGQFLIAEAQSKEDGLVAPVAMVLWARVSGEIDRRLSTELDTHVPLAPTDWNSGDIPWIIAMAGDRRVIGAMLKPLQEAHKGHPFKLRAKDKDGRETVLTVDPNPQMATAPG